MIKYIKFFLFVASALILLSACSGSKSVDSKADKDDAQKERPLQAQVTQMENPVRDEVVNAEPRRKLKTELNMYDKIKEFSFDLFKTLSKENSGENVSFSPVSLNIAFGMVYAGAAGKTAEEISSVIGFPKDLNAFYKEFGGYHNHLYSLMNDTAIEFNLANRVFLEQTFEILKEFKNNINKYFKGGFESMDFLNDPALSEQRINSWVEEMTNDRIQDLLPRGTIDPLTRMILVNAIYIKSEWKHPFDENRTREKVFSHDENEKLNIEFMIQRKEGIPYTKVNDFEVIELEYNTPELSLLVVLPKESKASNIQDKVPDAKDYKAIISSLSNKEVHMEIPKFKIESDFYLNEPLMENGLVSPFKSANFSGITGSADLEISDVIQKVFFEIDEKGSEAAAATAIVMRMTSSGPNMERPDPIYFIANRPFFFILKENRFDTPLFIGQFVGDKE